MDNQRGRLRVVDAARLLVESRVTVRRRGRRGLLRVRQPGGRHTLEVEAAGVWTARAERVATSGMTAKPSTATGASKIP